MAVALNLGGKNYQYTPRHPYGEKVVADEECAFHIEAPDGHILFAVSGEKGNPDEKILYRHQDLTTEEVQKLLQYGFFSPSGTQPFITENVSEKIQESIFKKFSFSFLKR
jgi:hypothetical protein